MSIETDPYDIEILKQRIRNKYNQGRLLSIFTLGSMLTPEQILEEVENETEIGWDILKAEQKFLEEAARRGKNLNNF